MFGIHIHTSTLYPWLAGVTDELIKSLISNTEQNNSTKCEWTVIKYRTVDSPPFHSQAHSLPGANPWNFRSLTFSLPGTFAPQCKMVRKLSFPGTFVLKSIHSLELSFPRTFLSCYSMTLICDIRFDCILCYDYIRGKYRGGSLGLDKPPQKRTLKNNLMAFVRDKVNIN